MNYTLRSKAEADVSDFKVQGLAPDSHILILNK